MATNFLNEQLLTAPALNAAFADTLSLTQTTPQQILGPLSANTLDVVISLQTQDLTVTGNTFFLCRGMFAQHMNCST